MNHLEIIELELIGLVIKLSNINEYNEEILCIERII